MVSGAFEKPHEIFATHFAKPLPHNPERAPGRRDLVPRFLHCNPDKRVKR
jgi:hypothetical protein